ncbi:uncharacterized protein LOC133178237 [Saccostrea echinata]|uniref:uncharacterized protein LOC133178237 n=1 Tax=Saccostrea echinata TaxID=191078 RepID=UPI002A809EBB|nr:uncharacterized protein LOC133178237 [Saccostrea echinata]
MEIYPYLMDCYAIGNAGFVLILIHNMMPPKIKERKPVADPQPPGSTSYTLKMLKLLLWILLHISVLDDKLSLSPVSCSDTSGDLDNSNFVNTLQHLFYGPELPQK